jgi:regulator of RNase E activity RraA
VIAGVTVEPGDVVIADATGVAFVPRARAAEVLAVAAAVQERERAIAADLRAGSAAAAGYARCPAGRRSSGRR